VLLWPVPCSFIVHLILRSTRLLDSQGPINPWIVLRFRFHTDSFFHLHPGNPKTVWSHGPSPLSTLFTTQVWAVSGTLCHGSQVSPDHPGQGWWLGKPSRTSQAFLVLKTSFFSYTLIPPGCSCTAPLFVTFTRPPNRNNSSSIR